MKNDEEIIEKLYHDMYRAMVTKDRAELDRVHDDSFVLIHMTGMHQNKQVYIDSIMDAQLCLVEKQSLRVRSVNHDEKMQTYDPKDHAC